MLGAHYHPYQLATGIAVPDPGGPGAGRLGTEALDAGAVALFHRLLAHLGQGQPPMTAVAPPELTGGWASALGPDAAEAIQAAAILNRLGHRLQHEAEAGAIMDALYEPHYAAAAHFRAAGLPPPPPAAAAAATGVSFLHLRPERA